MLSRLGVRGEEVPSGDSGENSSFSSFKLVVSGVDKGV